jgi:hypothetical protein
MSSRMSAFAPPTVAAWNIISLDTVSRSRAAMRAKVEAFLISSIMLCGVVSVPMPMVTPART